MPILTRPFRCLCAALLGLVLALPAAADEAVALKAALAAGAAGNWPAATAAASGAGTTGQDIITWQRLRAGEGALGEYEDFLRRRPDWPGLALLREKGEEAVARSTTPDRVIGYFGAQAPRTATGALALVRALDAAGRGAEADAAAVAAWRVMPFTVAEETMLLALKGQVLAAEHETRLDNLLWDGRKAEAGRMLAHVGEDWRALGAARLALRAEVDGVDARIAAVPAALTDDSGLAYERFLWRARKDRYPDAAALLAERSASAATLGRPAAWAGRRATLARWLLREGQPQAAQSLAARHHLTGGQDYADLEFLAGFIALRRLNDAETALGHFRRLRAAVATPISLSRAAYWEGRALEVLGKPDDAAAAFAYAAEFQTAYYGLLAAERAGIPLSPDLLIGPDFPDWRSAAFAGSSVLQAALLAQKAGDVALTKRFVLHLAEGLDRVELGQLSDLMLALDEPHIAVMVGKAAAERGVILPRAAFPVTALVPDGLPVSRALALSVARRESEFDVGVTSSAGARGLMQVMPETARMMADKTGQPFAPARLTVDAAYNASLGAAYLAQLVAEFGPSVALVASGYNAGPGRPRRWLQDFGDPRRADVDAVDWVEMIPFTETRTYVMRVVESVVIYRARLKGQAGPVQITPEIKG